MNIAEQDAADIIARAKRRIISGETPAEEYAAIDGLWPEHWTSLQAFTDDLRRAMEETARTTPQQQRAALQPVAPAETADGRTYLLILRGVVTTYALHTGTIKRTPRNAEIYAINS